MYLVSQHLGPGLLCLLLVDVLHQDTLVLEGVSLCLQVQLVVQVAINLLGLPESKDTLLVVHIITETFRGQIPSADRSVKFLNI